MPPPTPPSPCHGRRRKGRNGPATAVRSWPVSRADRPRTAHAAAWARAVSSVGGLVARPGAPSMAQALARRSGDALELAKARQARPVHGPVHARPIQREPVTVVARLRGDLLEFVVGRHRTRWRIDRPKHHRADVGIGVLSRADSSRPEAQAVSHRCKQTTALRIAGRLKRQHAAGGARRRGVDGCPGRENVRAGLHTGGKRYVERGRELGEVRPVTQRSTADPRC